MGELKTRVDELKMENEYQLRLKDMSYNEKIKELTEKFIQEMESLKTKNQVLKTEKDKEEAKHEEELSEFLEKHAKELQDLGTSKFNWLVWNKKTKIINKIMLTTRYHRISIRHLILSLWVWY